MMILKRIERYFRVGILLHSIALMSLLIALFVSQYIRLSYRNDNFLASILFLWLTAFILSITILAELDVRSRYQNYKQIKDQIFENGYQTRIMKPMLKSRCQRDAAILAARESGLESRLRSYFSVHGYRWYHVIPDFVFSNPQFFFSKYFWMTTFFVKKYNSKHFDY